MSGPTCGNCQHSRWQRTRGGRISLLHPGRCTQEDAMAAEIRRVAGAPIFSRTIPYAMAIWTDSDATTCPRFTR